MNIPHSDTELKERLNKLRRDKKEFLENRISFLNKMKPVKELDEEQGKIVEDLREIDREVQGLAFVISNSVSLAKSIIEPVREREKSIQNISKTMHLLEIENKIKHLLTRIKNEKSKQHQIENKINIILEANQLISYNHIVFDQYRDSFLQESQDVLKYLQTQYEEMHSRLFQSLDSVFTTRPSVKELNLILNEMDKNCILKTKLTEEENNITTFFSILSQFAIKVVTKGGNRIKEVIEFIEKGLIIPQSPNKNINKNPQPQSNITPQMIQEKIQLITHFIHKIFIQIAALVNERKIIYFKEFQDFHLFHHMIITLLSGVEEVVRQLVTIVMKYSEKIVKENNIQELDFISREQINILSSFEKFKFFICIIIEKIHLSGKLKSHLQNNNSSSNSSQSLSMSKLNNDNNNLLQNNFFKEFNAQIYIIGEQYANCEIKFMKNKLASLFKEESQSFHIVLDKHLNCKYEELSQFTLTTIEDFFYILKISGSRSIDSLNLQISLAIINNIKSLISEDLIELLDLKISAILKAEFKNSYYNNGDIKFSCNDVPSLSSKFTHGNLYLISCLNSIDQSKLNISDLFEEFKITINNLLNSSQNSVFNHTKIKLYSEEDNNTQLEEEKINNSISYFKKNEMELVKITFSDIDSMIVNKYEEYISRKLKIAFEFLLPTVKANVDILNSVNFFVDGKNIQNLELTESFSIKFIEDCEKYLRQWKEQMSENSFNKFLSMYAEYTCAYIENLLLMKRYSTYGVIILEKDISKIVNYFQSKATISIREKFNRLMSIVKVLNFESREELIDYLSRYDDIKLKKNEIEQIRKLRKE